MKEVVLALVHSRKVLLATAGIIITLLGAYAGVDRDTLLVVNALLGVLIASIAFEDVGGKLGDSVANSLMLLNRVLQEKAKNDSD
jgi:hypothetical protein